MHCQLVHIIKKGEVSKCTNVQLFLNFVARPHVAFCSMVSLEMIKQGNFLLVSLYLKPYQQLSNSSKFAGFK